jgi:hypothetical protein
MSLITPPSASAVMFRKIISQRGFLIVLLFSMLCATGCSVTKTDLVGSWKTYTSSGDCTLDGKQIYAIGRLVFYDDSKVVQYPDILSNPDQVFTNAFMLKNHRIVLAPITPNTVVTPFRSPAIIAVPAYESNTIPYNFNLRFGTLRIYLDEISPMMCIREKDDKTLKEKGSPTP